MKSILSATVCAAVLAVAVPALAATDDAPMHHRHHMHGKHSGMMRKGGSGDNAETAKLNEQSLANAKGGAVPASASSSGMAPSGSGMSAPGNAMAPSSGTGMSAPGTGMGSTGTATDTGTGTGTGTGMAPSSGGAMAAPGTGMSAPASGAMGNTMPGNAPATTSPAPATPDGK